MSDEKKFWESLTYWERAEISDFFKREGKERWLRDCIMLRSREDFRIAYKSERDLADFDF